MNEIISQFFSTFTWIDALDICLVAWLIYQIFQLLKGTIALNILIGLAAIYFVWLGVKRLELNLLSSIMDKISSVGIIALIIVFQQEIRRFLLLVGKNTVSNPNGFWQRLFFNKSTQNILQTKITPIIEACQVLAKNRVGALIVLSRSYDEFSFANNGEKIEAHISKRLIETIFAKQSPLHDGAMVIADEEIKLAGCILPLTDNTELPTNLGLRHRAAVGITENTDSLAIIVSEETGYISFSEKGKIRVNITPQLLEQVLVRQLV